MSNENQRHLRPILVTGVPRSGTTWTGRALSFSSGSLLVHEPDNEYNNIYSFIAKRNRKRIPFLEAEDVDTSIQRFWDFFFNHNLLPTSWFGRSVFLIFSDVLAKCFNKHILFDHKHQIEKYEPINRTLGKYIRDYQKYMSATHRIIKSVHCCLCLPFIDHYFRPKIVIIFRHPANVIASYIRLNLSDGDLKLFRQRTLVERYLKPYIVDINRLQHPLSYMGLQVAIIYYVIEQQLKKYEDWISTTHELLCSDPLIKFQQLYNKLDLEWNSAAENFIANSNKPGNGYNLRRLAADQPDLWKSVFSTHEIEQIQEGYRILPVEHYRDFRNN